MKAGALSLAAAALVFAPSVASADSPAPSWAPAVGVVALGPSAALATFPTTPHASLAPPLLGQAATAPATRMRSPGLFAAGVTFDVIAGLCLVGGTIVTAADLSSNASMGLATVVLGMPLFAGALVFGGAGIPMTVVGAQRVPVTAAALPSVRVGPGTASATWRF